MSLHALVPELMLTVFGLAALVGGFYTERGREIGIASLIVLGLASVIVFVQLVPWIAVGPLEMLTEDTIGAGVLRLDAFAHLFRLLLVLVTFIIVSVSFRYLEGKPNQGEYYALLLISTVGMMGVVAAMDLIVLFITLEVAALTTYALAAYNKGDTRGAEAAAKYFIVGAFSSAWFLFGISLVYGVAGSTRFGAIQSAIAATPGDPALLLAIGMTIVGLGFKILAAPFHMWVPDVYEGAPEPVTAFLASSSQKIGFAAVFKIFLIGLLAARAQWDLAVGLLAVATMTAGNLLALNQDNIKRMLAYSSVAQTGYVLMALPVAGVFAIGATQAGQLGLAGGVFHIVTHAFMKGGAFIVVAALTTVGVGEALISYKGLANRNFFLAASLAVFLLALTGIPPLSGFASKFVLFSSAVNASQVVAGMDWLLWLAIAGVINSAVSLYYYVRVIKYMFVDEGPDADLEVPLGAKVAVGVAVAFTIVMGIIVAPFLDASLAAAGALL